MINNKRFMNIMMCDFGCKMLAGMMFVSVMGITMTGCGSEEPGVAGDEIEVPDGGESGVRRIVIKAMIGEDGRGSVDLSEGGSVDMSEGGSVDMGVDMGYGGFEAGYGRVAAQEDEGTRTTRFFWEVGDEVGIYTSEPGKAVTFRVTEVKDGVAVMEGEMDVRDGDVIHGVYPRFAVESDAMTVQNGTLEDVGDCLLMTASSTFDEEDGMTLMFHHEASLMTFNLTFPKSVTSVTDLCLENALSRCSFTSSGVEVLGSEPIVVAGPLVPDSEGRLAVHVVMLPGSKFNTFDLTCTTNEGDFRMPRMSSENIAAAGKNHRTSRTMVPYSPYTMAVVESSGMATVVENVQHDHGMMRWASEEGLAEGVMISVCNEGVWKCFHALTQEEMTRGYIALPDVNAGCTVDVADATRNDWVTAVCMGGMVSTTYDGDGAKKPLYWATGNLVAIDLGDGETAFRLATLEEMEASQTTGSPFRHRPDASGAEGLSAGAMWDMFLYGDPTGRAASSSFKTPTGKIAGTSNDIAHVALGYSWRLPYVPQTLSGTDTTNRSKTNELWALMECQYAAGWLTYDSNRLYFPLAGTYYSSSWHDVGRTGYVMTGNVSSKMVVYLYIDSYNFASSSESAGVNNSSAFNVRPVTD